MLTKSVTKLASTPIAVLVSATEAASGRLGWKNLERATRALHRDGLVVLQNAIPDHGPLDHLNQKMIADAKELQARGEDSPYNYNKGNIQQDPPLLSKYFSPSIFFNPLATQVTSSVMGPRPRLTFVSGNTAMPPETDADRGLAQPTHSDADFVHPNCPFALVVNVPLVDMTIENGSTEVWLGTHHSDISIQEGAHGERASGRIIQPALDSRRQVRPPCQPAIPKGSIVIRDLRLWHGGMPNDSTDPRVMLAMIHFAPWFRNAMKVEFADNLRGAVDDVSNELTVQASFIPEEEYCQRYLNRPFGNAYKFDQEELIEFI